MSLLPVESVIDKVRRSGLLPSDISRMTYGEITCDQAAKWLSGKKGMSYAVKHLLWRLCDEVGVVRRGRHVAVVVPDIGLAEGHRALFAERWYFRMGGCTYQVPDVGDGVVYAGERKVKLSIFELQTI